MNKIEQFIDDNGLDFTSYGSDLNSNCCILAGYACYLGLSFSELCEQADIAITDNEYDELRRVFEYAENNNYGDWWKHDEAKSMYKF